VRLLTLTTWHSVPDDDGDDDDEGQDEDEDEEQDDDPNGIEQSNDDMSKQLDRDEMLDGAHADVMLPDVQRHGFHPHAVHNGSPMPPPEQMQRLRRHVSHHCVSW
jgi:hypothetical protein